MGKGAGDDGVILTKTSSLLGIIGDLAGITGDLAGITGDLAGIDIALPGIPFSLIPLSPVPVLLKTWPAEPSAIALLGSSESNSLKVWIVEKVTDLSKGLITGERLTLSTGFNFGCDFPVPSSSRPSINSHKLIVS